MKTDSIFYQLFKNLPSSFFELIGQPSLTANAYEFTSIEVKQLAFRIDGLFLPTEEASHQPIYFTEVQFQLDRRFYQRFFAEIFLYLSQSELSNDWRGVVVFKSKSIDPGVQPQYRELLTSPRIRRIYLNELGETASLPLGIGVVKLIVESEQKVAESARQLLNKAEVEIADGDLRDKIIELIETIVWYKFPEKSRQEILEMFGLSDIKKTRAYQEIRQEGLEEGRLQGKLETVPRLLTLGLSMEQVAEALDLSIEQVRQAASEQQSK